MTRMSDEDYEAAKEIMFYMTRDQLQVGPEHSYFKGYFGNSPISDSAVADTYDDPNADPGDPNPRTFKIDSSNRNYLPVGYFIDEDASNIVSKIMGAPTSQQDPANSYIIYEFLSKD